MALPTSNLTIEDVANVLSGGLISYPLKMSDYFNGSLVNKYGLNPTYCSGSNANLRLSNLVTTPYSLGKFRGYNHNAAIPTSDASVFIDVGTLASGEDVNGTIKVYKTSDDTQIGLAVQVNAITNNITYNFYGLEDEYYIVWDLTKRNNGTPQSTSITWVENLTSTNGNGTNSGDWSVDTEFTVYVT